MHKYLRSKKKELCTHVYDCFESVRNVVVFLVAELLEKQNNHEDLAKRNTEAKSSEPIGGDRSESTTCLSPSDADSVMLIRLNNAPPASDKTGRTEAEKERVDLSGPNLPPPSPATKKNVSMVGSRYYS